MSKEEVIAAIQESAAVGACPDLYRSAADDEDEQARNPEALFNLFKSAERVRPAKTGPGYEADATELFKDWAGLVRKLGKLPTMAEYEMHGSYSVRPLIRRYGGWVHVPAGLQDFPREEKLEGEWSDVLDVIARHKEEELDGRRTSGSTHGRR